MSSTEFLKHLKHDSSLQHLPLFNTRFDLKQPSAKVAEAFAKNPLLPGVLLYDGKHFCNMMSRARFMEIMNQPYSKDLFNRRQVHRLLLLPPLQHLHPLILPLNTLISEAAEKCLQRPPMQLAEPIVVMLDEDDGCLLDMHQLLLAHVHIYDHTVNLLREEIGRSNALRQKLEIANRSLEDLAHLDGLTGIPNRRQMDKFLAHEWKRAAREQQPLSLMLCDIDYFKVYNDTYGHQAGDIALQKVAQCLHEQLKRPADFVARYGGEEFIIILPNTPHSGGRSMAENVLQAIRHLRIPHEGSQASPFLSLSIGLSCTVPTHDGQAESLVQCADQALYQAKEQGRNQVVMESCVP